MASLDLAGAPGEDRSAAFIDIETHICPEKTDPAKHLRASIMTADPATINSTDSLPTALAAELTARVVSLPAPWSVTEIAGGHAVVDAGGRRLAYVYKNTSLDHDVNSEALTDDEARRVAANIAKLPELLGHKLNSEG